MNEDLRNWFREKWVRMDTKGNIKGDCAREEGEGKPKCLPLAKASSMSKEKRAAAARRKRREDPVADRPGKGGKPVNVATEEASTSELIKKSHEKRGAPGTLKAKIKGPITLEKVRQLKNRPNATTLDKKQANFYINMHTEEYLEEKNTPTNPSLWSKAKSLAKQKFDVYPSAYANGWASKWYKSKGGGWKSVQEERPMKTLRDITEGADEDRPFEIVHKSGKSIGRYKTLKTARMVADKKDLEYGAIAHSVRRVKQDDQKTTSEGVVVMSDYKLDKKGRKYKAHRKTISPTAMDVAKGMRKGPQSELGEAVNPYQIQEEGDYPHVGTGTSRSMQMARDIATNKARSSMMKAKYGDDVSGKEIPAYDEDKLDLKSDDKGNYVATVKMREKIAAMKESINPYYEAVNIQGHNINDDDWYIVHNKTKKIVSSVGGKSHVGKQISFNAGYSGNKAKVDDEHTAYTGMKVKSVMAEEVDQIDEVGNTPEGKKTLQAYMSRSITNMMKNPEKGSQRERGMQRAADRLDKIRQSERSSKRKDTIIKKAKEIDNLMWQNEEAIQVDEISKKAAASYISKAAKDIAYDANYVGFVAGKKTKGHNPTEESPRELKRHAGIANALKRLVKEARIEQVDEISKKTVKSYLEKTVDPVYGIPKSKEKIAQRMQGISRAHQRVVGNKPTSEEVELDEASDYAIVSTHHFPDKSMAVKVKDKESGKEFHHVGSPTHLNNTLKSRYKINYRLVWDERNVKPANEEFEQVDEISKATATSYVRKKLSQMGKRSGDATPKDFENLARAYKRMGVSDKAMRENVNQIEEASLVKVSTNPDGSRTASVKTDTGKIVNHTFRKAASINKLLKRRYNISGSIPEN